MSVEDNRDAARRYLEDIWSKGDMAAVDDLCAPNFVFVLPVPPFKLEGPDTLKKLVNVNRTAFHGLTYAVEDIVTEGDRAVAYWTMSGVHEETWNNIEPTGKHVSIQGMTYFLFSGGQIVEARVQNDALGLLRQLGAVPPLKPS